MVPATLERAPGRAGCNFELVVWIINHTTHAMAANVVALGVEVRIAIPVELWPGVDLVIFAALALFLTLAFIDFPRPSFLIPPSIFIFGTCALLHHTIGEGITTWPETE